MKVKRFDNGGEADAGIAATQPASTFYDTFARNPTANYVPSGATRNVGTGVAVQNQFNLRGVPTNILDQIASGSYGPESININPSTVGSSLAFDPRFIEQLNLRQSQNQPQRPAHVYQGAYKDYMPTGPEIPRQIPSFFSPGFNPFSYTGVPEAPTNTAAAPSGVSPSGVSPNTSRALSEIIPAIPPNISNTQIPADFFNIFRTPSGVSSTDSQTQNERVPKIDAPEIIDEIPTNVSNAQIPPDFASGVQGGELPPSRPERDMSSFIQSLQSILSPYFSQPSIPNATFDTYTGYNPFSTGAVNPYIARMPQPERPAALPMPGPEQPATRSPTVQQNMTNPFVRSVGEGVAVDFGPSMARPQAPTNFPYISPYLQAYGRSGGVGMG